MNDVSFFLFNGSDNRVQLANSAYLDFTTENFSFYAEVELTDLTGIETLCWKGSDNTFGYYWNFNADGMYFVTNQSGAAQVTRWYSFLSTGSVLKLVVVRNGADVHMWLNGTQLPRDVVGSHSDPDTSSSVFELGSYGGASSWSDAKVFEFRAWSKALSQAEIDTLQAGGDVAGSLELEFNCNESSGDAIDQSGNGYDGSVVGTTTNFYNSLFEGTIEDSGVGAEVYKNYLVLDTFTASDGVLLANHIPDESITGDVWHDPDDHFQIQSNELVKYSGTDKVAYIDTGKTSYKAMGRLYINSAVAFDARIIVRHSGSQYIFFQIHSNSSGTIYVRNDALTILTFDSSWNISTGYKDWLVEVTEAGISITIDDVTVSYVGILYNTNTEFGLGYWSGCSPKFDTLEIYEEVEIGVDAYIPLTDSGVGIGSLLASITPGVDDSGTGLDAEFKQALVGIQDYGFSIGPFEYEEDFEDYTLINNYLSNTIDQSFLPPWIFEGESQGSTTWPKRIQLSAGSWVTMEQFVDMTVDSKTFTFQIEVGTVNVGTIDLMTLGMTDGSTLFTTAVSSITADTVYSVTGTYSGSGSGTITVYLTVVTPSGQTADFYIKNFQLSEQSAAADWQPTWDYPTYSYDLTRYGDWTQIDVDDPDTAFFHAIERGGDQEGFLFSGPNGYTGFRYDGFRSDEWKTYDIELDLSYGNDEVIAIAWRWTTAGGYWLLYRKGLGLFIYKSNNENLVDGAVALAEETTPDIANVNITHIRISVGVWQNNPNLFAIFINGEDVPYPFVFDGDHQFGSFGFLAFLDGWYVDNITVAGSGGGNEYIVVSSSFSLSDSGTGLDEATAIQPLGMDDTGSGLDGVSVSAQLSLMDWSGGVEVYSEDFESYSVRANFMVHTADDPTDVVWITNDVNPPLSVWPYRIEVESGESSTYFYQDVDETPTGTWTFEFKTAFDYSAPDGIKVTAQISDDDESEVETAIISLDGDPSDIPYAPSAWYKVEITFSAPTGSKIRCKLTVESQVAGSPCSSDVWQFQLHKGSGYEQYIETYNRPVGIGPSMTDYDWTRIDRDDTGLYASFIAGYGQAGYPQSTTGWTAWRYDESGSEDWDNYRYKFDIEYDTDDFMAVGFRWTTAGGYKVYYNGSNTPNTYLTAHTNQNLVDSSTVLASVDLDSAPSRCEIITSGEYIRVLFDGELRMAVTDSAFSKGSVGVLANAGTWVVDNIELLLLNAQESVSVTGVSPVYDYGYGESSISIGTALTVTDSGVGLSSVIVSTTLAVSDSGTGVTSTPITVGLIPVADAGKGTDIPAASVGLLVSDSGTGEELPAVMVTLSVDDLASGLDVTDIFRRFHVLDQNTAVLEQIHDIIVQAPVADTGRGAESVVIFQSVLITDSGSFLDDLSLVNYIVIEDSGTGVETIIEPVMMVGIIWRDSLIEDALRFESKISY